MSQFEVLPSGTCLEELSKLMKLQYGAYNVSLLYLHFQSFVLIGQNYEDNLCDKHIGLTPTGKAQKACQYVQMFTLERLTYINPACLKNYVHCLIPYVETGGVIQDQQVLVKHADCLIRYRLFCVYVLSSRFCLKYFVIGQILNKMFLKLIEVLSGEFFVPWLPVCL